MTTVAHASLGHLDSLRPIDESLQHDHPEHRFGGGHVDSSDIAELRAPAGKVRFFWIAQGTGAVEVPFGYRTQEGDGQPLPTTYRPDALDEAVAHHLRSLQEGLPSCHGAIRPHIEQLLGRWRGQRLVGDLAGDLWGIVNQGLTPEQWSSEREVVASLQHLFEHYPKLGWSTKDAPTSFEPIATGDQLVVTPETAVRVSGRFAYWWMDIPEQRGDEQRFTLLRRLDHIRDTSGGCNPSFDAYRRLLTCWQVDAPQSNRVNSHVVHIAAATASTHFHPKPEQNDGFGQSELYLVLDPATRGLRPASERPVLHVYPDLTNFAEFTTLPLQPGDTVYIPPGTGHRGMDVFVNVLAVPGFRPGNEWDIDAQIASAVGDQAPYNKTLAAQHA